MEYNICRHPINDQSENSFMETQTPHILIQNGYQYLQLIGEGSNGKTYKARNLKTGEEIAVKALKFSDNLKSYELFHREAAVLKSLNVKGIPRYYDFITQGNEFTECWLAQEYIQGRSLLDAIESGNRFDEFETLLIMRDVARIVCDLQTMYTPPIIHRDIKPSNIMLNGKITGAHELHLIDFGAVANPQKRAGGSTVAGTVGYMAPEQLMGECSIQSDYYAIGATALHLMTGIAPSDLPSQGFNLLFEEQLKTSISDIHPKTLELLHKLLAPTSQERPNDAPELIRLIDEALLALCKKDLKIIDRIALVLLTLLNVIFQIIKYILFAISPFIVIFCIIGMWVDYRTGVEHDASPYYPFVIIGCLAALPLIVFITNLVESMLYALRGSKKQALLMESQKHLPRLLEQEILENAEKERIKTKNRVQGTVVAVSSYGTEFVFAVGGRTYACFEPENRRRAVNDKVQVLYQLRQGKMYGMIDSREE